MTKREARALLFSCDTTQRARYSSATRDLLTEPRWGEWQAEPDYVDAREVRVPIHTARPEYAAVVAFWCLLACAVLAVVGMVAQAWRIF